MGEQFNQRCPESAGDTSCRRELKQLQLDLGPLEINDSGLQIDGLAGAFNVKGKGIKYSLDLEERSTPKTHAQLAKEQQTSNLLAAQDRAAVDRVAIFPHEADQHRIKIDWDKPLTPDDSRRIHQVDPITGERLV